MKLEMNHKIVSSLKELDQYRKDWENLRLQSHSSIFTSFDLVRLWLDTYHDTSQPQVVIVERHDTLVGLAPLCVQKLSVAGLPVRNLVMVGFGRNIIGYSLLSIIADNDDHEVLSELVRGVRTARWNMMQLYAMDPTTSTLKFLDLIKESFTWQPYAEVKNIFYEFPLEGDIAARFGRNSRRLLKKIRSDLERDGRLQVRMVKTVEEAESAMRLYVHQHQERWAQKGGSILNDERNNHQLVEMGKMVVGTGIGAIHEMLIDGEIAAQSLVLFDGNVVRGYRIGMMDKFKEFSVGKLLIMLVMEDLRARGFEGYDLLRGDEEYKYHMMTHERTLPAIQVLRGSLLIMSKARNFPPVQRMDERLKVRDRVLRRMNNR
jgi:CelD/BcsL family acetyltransferase involved in cellulose biosynthesis